MLNGHWLIAIFGKNMTLSGDSCKSIICYINFISRVVLFEFHLKFWNTDSVGIPVRSLL